MPLEAGFLLLLIYAHFEVFTRILYFIFQLEGLLEGMVKVYDFAGNFVGERLSNLLEALRSLEQLHEEGLNVGVRPNVALFVLHLIVKRVLYQLEAVVYGDLGRALRVLVKSRLRHDS